MKAQEVFENISTNPDRVFDYLNNLTIDKIDAEVLHDFYQVLKLNVLSFEVVGKKVFDVCGTGGSGKTRVNLSTALALSLNKEFTIAKHSNQASSGRVGSADVLSEMSYKICHNPLEAIDEIINKNIAFLFAPAFHHTLVDFFQIRRKINRSTIFNFIMPVLNPVKNIRAQMIGVSDLKMMKVMAELAKNIHKNIIFVHDIDNSLDDVSITGKTAIIEVFNGNINEYIVHPEDFNIKNVDNFSSISGFDNAQQNCNLVLEILNGTALQSYLSFLEINKIVATEFFNKCL
jgi:anthranilate phosphoribosyltransferase